MSTSVDRYTDAPPNIAQAIKESVPLSKEEQELFDSLENDIAEQFSELEDESLDVHSRLLKMLLDLSMKNDELEHSIETEKIRRMSHTSV
jgi:hypothetical protein